jgi:hypothetical protein
LLTPPLIRKDWIHPIQRYRVFFAGKIRSHGLLRRTNSFLTKSFKSIQCAHLAMHQYCFQVLIDNPPAARTQESQDPTDRLDSRCTALCKPSGVSWFAAAVNAQATAKEKSCQ